MEGRQGWLLERWVGVGLAADSKQVKPRGQEKMACEGIPKDHGNDLAGKVGGGERPSCSRVK